jgi:thymidine phosphorylase
MNIPLILSKVRDGVVLSTGELSEFARGLVSGDISDAQAGAFAMAVCVHGLSEEERVGPDFGDEGLGECPTVGLTRTGFG